MSQSIITALAKLDVTNENHWTAEGLPRLETVKLLAGDNGITREQVQVAVPGFTRANPKLPQAVVTPVVSAGQPELDPKPAPQSKEPEADEDDDKATALAALKEAQDEANAKRAALEKAKAEYEVARDKLVEIEVAMAEQYKSSGMAPIRGYLDRQKDILKKRHEIKMALSGINLRELQNALRSPLDSALSRRRKDLAARF